MTNISDAIPCPFCGSAHLSVVDWYDDVRGQLDAIECDACLGAAPAAIWNQRALSIEAAIDLLASHGYGISAPGCPDNEAMNAVLNYDPTSSPLWPIFSREESSK